MDDWARVHAEGGHQTEIVALMEKLDKCFHGHSRAIAVIVCLRMIAVMLGPATDKTRKKTLIELPIAIGNILREMDKMVGRH